MIRFSLFNLRSYYKENESKKKPTSEDLIGRYGLGAR
jgi:hypothetical protein